MNGKKDAKEENMKEEIELRQCPEEGKRTTGERGEAI